MLIFVMPIFYSTVSNNISLDMARRELKEIADYASNTLSNLYFLVNSTDCLNVSLTKELMYLPSSVENSVYALEIEEDASKVKQWLLVAVEMEQVSTCGSNIRMGDTLVRTVWRNTYCIARLNKYAIYTL